MRALTKQTRILAALACCALVACGGGDKPQSAAVDSLATALNKLADTSRPFGKVAHQYGPPTGKIRVANLLEIDGKPYGPIDLYESHKPDSADVPVIKHLDYGQISDYVSPRAEAPRQGAKSYLFIFPADQKSAARPFGSLVEQSGWEAGDRISIALGPYKGAGGSSSIAIVPVPEAGKRLSAEQADTATKIQGAQGLLVVREANVNVDSLPELYLTVDGKCPHAPNDVQGRADQPSTASSSTTLFFPVAPGAHTLGVVASPRGSGLQNCNGVSPVGTTSATVEAGRRYMVWLFGQKADGFKVVAAPVAAQ